VGTQITDENLERGICFLSADPEAEHHELALAQAKEPAQKTHNVQQVSFKVQSLDDVRAFYHRLQQEGMRIDRTVTHGIACSVYFYDPEDNRVELYYTTPYQVRQPLGQAIDLEQSNAELLAFAQLLRSDHGTATRGAVACWVRGRLLTTHGDWGLSRLHRSWDWIGSTYGVQP